MKPRHQQRSVNYLILVTAIILTLTLASLSRAETITLVADEWCPINCAADALQPGYAVEIARQIFESAGYQVEYKTLNWSKSIEDARKGLYDGIIGAAKEEAEDFIFPSTEIGATANSFFVSKQSNWEFRGLESLNNICIGVIKSYEYGDEFDEYFANNKGNPQKVQEVSGDNPLEKNLKKLAGGRIDVVIEDRPVAEYTVKELGLQGQIKYAGNDGEPTDFFIAFSPKNPKAQQYAKLFSTGLEQLRGSGKLQEILDGYGLQDWRGN